MSDHNTASHTDPAAPSANAGNAGPVDPATAARRRACRVYVGNLPFSVAWFELKQHMKAVGDVAYASILQDNMGRSRGCGIVEFTSAELAQKAIATMNDTIIKGRKIFVREDRDTPKSAAVAANAASGEHAPQPQSSQHHHHHPQQHQQHSSDQPRVIFGGATGASSGAATGASTGTGTGSSNVDPSVADRQLFVKNLSWTTTWQTLKDTFRQVGTVVRADVFRRPDGMSRGIGVVLMDTPAEAKRAIETLNGVVLDGRPISVDYDKRTAAPAANDAPSSE